MPKSSSVINGTEQIQLVEFLPIEQKYVEAVSTKADQPVEEVVLFPVWTVIWMIGVMLCLAYFMVSYIRSYRKFGQSLPIENEILQEWYMMHDLKRKLLVRQSDQILAPIN